MKKILVVIFLFIVVVANERTANFTLSDYFVGEYYVYTNESVNEDTIDLKTCYMTANVRTDSAIGESMLVKNIEPLTAIKVLGGEVKFVEQLENGVSVIYAFSNKINSEVNANGSRVNLQVAVYDDYCVIGWPMILGSF